MILELLRLDLAPAAIINIRTEPLLATGPVVGKHFYGKTFSIVNVDNEAFTSLKIGLYAEIESKKSHSIIRVSEK